MGDGCLPTKEDLTGAITIARRGGGCDFATKAKHAAAVGAAVLVVEQHDEEPLLRMGARDPPFPAVVGVAVRARAGAALRRVEGNATVRLRPAPAPVAVTARSLARTITPMGGLQEGAAPCARTPEVTLRAAGKRRVAWEIGRAQLNGAAHHGASRLHVPSAPPAGLPSLTL